MADIDKPLDDVVTALCVWIGPGVPRQDVEDLVVRLRARKGVRSVSVAEMKMQGARPDLAVVDEVQDLAVECECGTVWPDGVMGKGHGDMVCESESESDICFCGCERRVHRSSVQWGESCDGCGSLGHMATYQWRHPFLLAED